MEENKDFQTHRGFIGCKLFHGGGDTGSLNLTMDMAPL